MKFQDSHIDSYLFEDHTENSSLVGGMPLTKLLANKRLGGGNYDYIDKINYTRFDNMVIPAGFYMERDKQIRNTIPNESQYIDEHLFDELFDISVQTKMRKNTTKSKKLAIKKRATKRRH